MCKSKPLSESLLVILFFQKSNLTEKRVKGGEWTKWIILTIDIRPPALNEAVEFAKLAHNCHGKGLVIKSFELYFEFYFPFFQHGMRKPVK